MFAFDTTVKLSHSARLLYPIQSTNATPVRTGRCEAQDLSISIRMLGIVWQASLHMHNMM